MADCTVKSMGEFESIFGGGFHRVRAGLGVSAFGLSVMEFPAGFDHYPEHTQEHDGQEEVYTVLSGSVTLIVGGEEHTLKPGTFARVGPGERRRLRTDAEPATVLAIGGTPGQVYVPPEFTEEGGSESLGKESPAG